MKTLNSSWKDEKKSRLKDCLSSTKQKLAGMKTLGLLGLWAIFEDIFFMFWGADLFLIFFKNIVASSLKSCIKWRWIIALLQYSCDFIKALDPFLSSDQNHTGVDYKKFDCSESRKLHSAVKSLKNLIAANILDFITCKFLNKHFKACLSNTCIRCLTDWFFKLCIQNSLHSITSFN